MPYYFSPRAAKEFGVDVEKFSSIVEKKTATAGVAVGQKVQADFSYSREGVATLGVVKDTLKILRRLRRQGLVGPRFKGEKDPLPYLAISSQIKVYIVKFSEVPCGNRSKGHDTRNLDSVWILSFDQKSKTAILAIGSAENVMQNQDRYKDLDWGHVNYPSNPGYLFPLVNEVFDLGIDAEDYNVRVGFREKDYTPNAVVTQAVDVFARGGASGPLVLGPVQREPKIGSYFLFGSAYVSHSINLDPNSRDVSRVPKELLMAERLIVCRPIMVLSPGERRFLLRDTVARVFGAIRKKVTPNL